MCVGMILGAILLTQGQVDDVHGWLSVLRHLFLCCVPNVLPVCLLRQVAIELKQWPLHAEMHGLWCA
jgi:hypothetical protein